MRKKDKKFMLFLASFCLFVFFAVYFVINRPIYVSPGKINANDQNIQQIVNSVPDSNRDDAQKNPNSVIKIDLCSGHYQYKSDDFVLLKEISQYQNLKYLELCHINIHTIPPQFANLKKLEYIHNIDGSLTNIPDPIGSLTNLKYLSFSSNKITTISDSFANLQNLEELDLSFNTMTDLPPVILKLKNLKRLSILGTLISHIPDEIKDMSSLEELDIRSSLVDQKEIDRISKILPSHIKLIY